MTAQTKYITSLLSVFSTYLENLNVSRELALLTTEKFVVFISNREKSDKNWHENWSTNELEKFISTENVPHKSAVLMRKFVSNFTPFEVSIFLHEFLASLQSNNHSNSTIKNYRSDIQQFANIQSQTQIKNFFNPEHLRSFVHQQLQEGLKLSTIKRKLSSISQFALWAEQEGIVSDASFWISDIESLVAGKSIVHESEMGVVRPTQLKTATKELDDFLLSLEIDGHSDATVKNYKSDIGQFLAFSKQANLEKIITQNEIKDFVVSQRKAGLKVSSIKRKITSITQFALWAEERGSLVGVSKWIHSIPTQLFETEKTSPVLNQTNHGAQKKDISTEKFELKLKPTTLIHAHDEKKQQKIWSLPVPEFAQETQTHHQETEKPQSALKGIKASLQDFATQINAKRNKQFLPYLNLAMMLIFAIGLGVLGYQQFIEQAPTPFAYPSTPVRPNRELSFQGRLTDTAQNPITTATNMAFRLYDTGPGAGGTQLWSSGTCSVTPDQDGIFNVGLGDDCGSEITEDVFSENSNVWLEVQIVSETLTPRQSIKTVPYALNSETVQGYPVSATGAATTNTILVMDAGGQVLLGEVSPRLKSTTGTFSIEAQTLSLETSSGSNGNIIINPDGTGKVIVQSDLDLEGYLHAPGATFSATYAGGTALVARSGPSGTANIQEWQNSAGTALNVVDANGNVGIGTTAVTGKLHVTGAATGKALAILNETGDQNIFVASSSGSTKFIMENDGDILTSSVVTIGGANNTAGSLYFFNSGVRLARTGNSGLNIITSGGGATGGTTISGIASGVPLTVIGAASQTANIFEVDNSSGTDLFNVDANGNVGIGSTNPGYALDVAGEFNLTDAIRVAGDAGTSGYLLTSSGGGAMTWTDPASLTGANYWRLNLGTISPYNDTLDLLVGANSTASAKFAFINVNSGTPTASISGNLAIAVPTGADPATTYNVLNGGSFNLTTSPGGNAGATSRLFIANNGNIGINTTNPTAKVFLKQSADTTGTDGIYIERSSVTSHNGSLYVDSSTGSLNVGGGIRLRLFDSSNMILDSDGGGSAVPSLPRGVLISASGVQEPAIQISADTTERTYLRYLTAANNVSGRFKMVTTNNPRLKYESYLTLESTPTNYERLAIYPDSSNNIFRIEAENGGTGTLRNLTLQGGGGNVGIGSLAPAYTLDVVGELNLTDAIRSAGDAGTSGYLLTSSGGGAMTWTDPASLTGANYWRLNLGTISPYNDTLDLLVGANSTASAKFAFMNVNSGTPTASISGNLAIAVPTGADPATTYNVLNGGSFNLTTSPGGNAGATSRLFIANNGNVGIGSTSPGALLDISKGSSSASTGTTVQQISFTDNAGSTSVGGITNNALNIAHAVSGTVGVGRLQTINGANIAITNSSTIVGEQYISGLQINNNFSGDDSGASQVDLYGIKVTTNGDVEPGVSTHYGGYFLTSGTAAANIGLRLNTFGANTNWGIYSTGEDQNYFSGNVGIGTSGPVGKLNVSGAITGKALTILDETGNQAIFVASASGTNRFIIQNDGNVGIGSTSPAYKIDVNGTGRFSGAVDLDADLELNSTLTDINGSVGTSGQILSSTATGVDWIDVSSIGYNSWTIADDDTDTYSIVDGNILRFTSSDSNILTNLTNGDDGDENMDFSIRLLGDAVAGDGLTGGADNVLVGADIDVTFTVNAGDGIALVTDTVTVDEAYAFAWTGAQSWSTTADFNGDVSIADTNIALDGASTTLTSTGAFTLTPGGAVILGDGGDTMVINTSDWDISAVGAMTGITGISNDGSYTQTGTSANTFTGTATFSNATYSALFTGGNVGIGSATPAYQLDLVGEFNLTDAIRVAGDAGTSGYLLTSSGGGANTWTDPATLVSGSTWWANTLNVLHPKNEYASVVDLAIGGTATASADIQLFANGAAVFNEQSNSVDFRVESNGDTHALFVQGSANNIGIGTSAPVQKLQVSSNQDTTIRIETLDTSIITDQLLGKIEFQQNDANSSGVAGSMRYEAEAGIGGAGSFDTRFVIATTVDSTLTDRFYINSDGNVGIGESTPDAKLQVAGDVFPSTDDTYDLGSSSLRWQDLYLGPASLHIGTNGNEGIIGYNTTGNYLSFDPDGDADADVSIVDAGYLGIGTTAPIHALEVNRAVTGKALVLLKETGDQNILTASNSAGVTRFVMANTGYMHAERFADMSNSAYFLDPAASGTSMAVVENVGIGTTTPGARLDVRNSSTEDILNLFDGATEVLTVLDGGNVGIGTTTPGYIADIVGRSRIRGASSNGGGFWLTTSAAPTTDITYFGRGSDAEAWAGIYNNGAWRVYIPDASGNVGIGTSIPAQSLDTGGDLRVGGNDITDSGNTTRITLGASTYVTSTTFNLTGTTNFNATSLTAMDTAATMSWSGVTALTFAADNATIYGSDVADGDITIHGTSNATRTTSYVNLQPTAGNVGIGTTAPASKLHIVGGTRSSSPTAVGIHMGLDGSSNYGIEITNSGGIPHLDFQNDTTGTDFDARIGLYGDDILALMGANVGIGTTAPAAQLSFEGTAGKTIQVDPNTNAAAGGALIVSSGDSGSGTNLAGGEMRVRSGSSTGNNNSFISFYTPAAGNTGTAVRTPIERARITSTGIGIGTTTLVRALTVAGSARITTSVAVTDTLTLCTDANGDIEFKSGACTVSSIKYKQNVQNLSYGLDAINEMNPVFFEYKDIVGNDLSGRTKRKVGFIAEEMQLVIPEVIIYQDGEIDGIDYAFLTSVLAKGIQELDAKVESIFTNLVASTAHITDLTVESLKIGGQTIEEYIASVVSSQNNSNSNELLSPIEGELTVDSLITNSVTASGSSTLGSLLVSDDLNTNTLTVSGDATVSGSLLAGLIGSDILVTNTATTSNLLVTKDATIAGTLIANHIDTTSSRIAALEAGIAQLETVRATTAELVTATVSGTLYADNIYNFENKVASTLQQPGLLDVLLGNNESTASASYLQDLYNTVNKTEFNASESADLDLTLAELNLTSDDVALTGSALFVEKYFKVNGAGFISDSLAIGNKLFVGETMQIADGLVRYTTADPTNQILKIQPEGQGSIELLAGIVTIDDSGKVTVNGDLEVTGNAKIAGTLLTNMLKPGDFGNPLQVQVAGVDTASGEIKKSRFEIINEVGTPVATFSAEGNAEFAGSVNISGGIGIANQDLGSNENNELSADKTSGKATIKSGASEVIIKSALIKSESLVYVTAVGSTGNQVLYVKSQASDDPNTPDQEGRFVVGFDNPTTMDVSFNWWIVN